MAKDSRSERERLKEEYKEHYRSMRETKERLSRSQKTQNIARALKEMDKGQLLESFDSFLLSVQQRLASVEARLDTAIGSLFEEPSDIEQEQALDEEMKEVKAKETLRQIKMDMGTLYKEIEQQAESMKVNKTIGRQAPGKDSETQ